MSPLPTANPKRPQSTDDQVPFEAVLDKLALQAVEPAKRLALTEAALDEMRTERDRLRAAVTTAGQTEYELRAEIKKLTTVVDPPPS